MKNYKDFDFISYIPNSFNYKTLAENYGVLVSSTKDFSNIEWNYDSVLHFINDGWTFRHNLSLDNYQEISIDNAEIIGAYRLFVFSDNTKQLSHLIISSDFDIIFKFLVSIIG